MAESVRETMNIGNICRGGVMERFERALDEVFNSFVAPGAAERFERAPDFAALGLAFGADHAACSAQAYESITFTRCSA